MNARCERLWARPAGADYDAPGDNSNWILDQGLKALDKEICHVFTVSDPGAIATHRVLDRTDTRLKRVWSENGT